MEIKKVSIPKTVSVKSLSSVDRETEDDEFFEDLDEFEELEELEDLEEIDQDIDYEPVQKEAENIDEVSEATSMTSEDVHGGEEATGDIENSPNASDDGIQENDQTDARSEDIEENDDEDEISDYLKDALDEFDDVDTVEELRDKLDELEELEESSDKSNDDSNSERNYDQAFNVNNIKYKEYKIRNQLFKLISRISEDTLPEKVDGSEAWDVESLMYRSFDKRPLHTCKTDYERERLVVAIDTSGSCANWEPFFSKIAQILTEFDICQIYLAPNADVQSVYDKKLGDYKTLYDYHNNEMISEDEYNNNQLNKLKNRNILFVGDFDGAATLCESSKNNNVYWLSNELRYNDFNQHDWNRSYDFDDYQGHYYNIDTVDDLINATKQILRDINRQYSTSTNRSRHISFMKKKGEYYD